VSRLRADDLDPIYVVIHSVVFLLISAIDRFLVKYDVIRDGCILRGTG
jgi:hypothetical protein